ncbi:glycoside hydrolase superfamily [Gorgonomyces haynaldii]|nr:glycoside hydrolase superfamily [Gorgonomyces haynaldii]
MQVESELVHRAPRVARSNSYVLKQEQPKQVHAPIRKSFKKSCCGFLFCIKATLALLIAFAALGGMAYKIITMKKEKVPWKPPPVVPKFTPTLNGPECAYDARFSSRVEPPDGTFFWGFHLDWSKDTPRKLVDRLNGKKPSIINGFIDMNATDFQIDMINWMAQEISFIGAIFEVTVVPKGTPIEEIPDSLLYKFAQQMQHINALYGVPVLLRFGHEMNGNWLTAYSQKPRQYIQAFVTLSNYVHGLTNMTAMVWGPNIGTGYPWGPDIPRPAATADPIAIENFNRMDTNGDGLITNLDDPYLPYFPGEEYVDWVALSLYQYDIAGNGQSNAATTAYIQAAIQGDVPTSNRNIYQNFAIRYRKPFMLGETGLAVNSDPQTKNPYGNLTPAQQVALKESWWQAILATSVNGGALPKFKAATWFEETKEENDYITANKIIIKDFTITADPETVAAFNRDTDALGARITWANRLNVTCAGGLISQ